MTTFLMFGNYSSDAVKKISSERTKKAESIIKKSGGKLVSIYALLGQYDLIFITKFPGIAEAMKASLALSELTGISFKTSPALKVDDFDKLASEK